MQHTLDHYIGNLLYFHECVVVPGFGAFLTRSYAAEINPATHMLRPPSKRVVFNARIQDNDGLLAQHIARVEGKSYRSATDGIEIAARGWKKSLRAGRKVNLSGIGRLFIDDKGKLQFNPAHDVNYDIHSYGLNIFRANAMEREQEIKRDLNKAIEKHQSQKAKSGVKITPNKVKEATTKINWVRWAATLGPVAALLVVGAYFYNQNPDTFGDLGGKIGSAFSSENNIAQDSSTPQEINESGIGFSAAERLNKNFGPEDDVISEKGGNESVNERNETKPGKEEATSGEEVAESKKPSNADESAQELGKIQIIVGAFSNVQNAERYTSDLQAKGWDAYIYKSGNLNRVAIGKLNDTSKAQTLLSRVKKEVNYQAWINIR